MSAERDVEAVAAIMRAAPVVLTPRAGEDSRNAARAVLDSEWYAERLTEARREGAAEVSARIEAAACVCGGDGVRYTVGADRRCPVHGYGDTVPWRYLRKVLWGDA